MIANNTPVCVRWLLAAFHLCIRHFWRLPTRHGWKTNSSVGTATEEGRLKCLPIQKFTAPSQTGTRPSQPLLMQFLVPRPTRRYLTKAEVTFSTIKNAKIFEGWRMTVCKKPMQYTFPHPSSQTAVAVSPNSTPVYINCPLKISPAEPHGFPLLGWKRGGKVYEFDESLWARKKCFIFIRSASNVMQYSKCSAGL